MKQCIFWSMLIVWCLPVKSPAQLPIEMTALAPDTVLQAVPEAEVNQFVRHLLAVSPERFLLDSVRNGGNPEAVEFRKKFIYQGVHYQIYYNWWPDALGLKVFISEPPNDGSYQESLYTCSFDDHLLDGIVDKGVMYDGNNYWALDHSEELPDVSLRSFSQYDSFQPYKHQPFFQAVYSYLVAIRLQ